MNSNKESFSKWGVLKTQEAEIIQIFKEAFPADWEDGIGNDCALLKNIPQEQKLLLTKDLLVEGTHFYKQMPAESLAFKALAVNISDICSDGGIPKYIMVGLSFNKTHIEYTKQLVSFLVSYAKELDITIIGGDTTASDVLIISITCIGLSKNPWLRKNAKVGDYIYVTGAIGLSGEGLKRIRQNNIEFLMDDRYIHKHCYPPIYIELVKYLTDNKIPIHAGVDISDGFIEDLTQILIESNLSAQVSFEKVPVPIEIDRQQAYFSGEDYELIFTSPALLDQDSFEKIGFKISCIGKTIETEKFGEIYSESGGIYKIDRNIEQKFFHF